LLNYIGVGYYLLFFYNQQPTCVLSPSVIATGVFFAFVIMTP